jgi:hypothetical protein
MMFKYKVSIYLKSGNVIYVKSKGYQYNHLFYFFHDYSLNEILTKYISPCMHIDLLQVEGIIIKKWWQRWG